MIHLFIKNTLLFHIGKMLNFKNLIVIHKNTLYENAYLKTLKFA